MKDDRARRPPSTSWQFLEDPDPLDEHDHEPSWPARRTQHWTGETPPWFEEVRSVVVERIDLLPARARSERRAGFFRVVVRTHEWSHYYSPEFPRNDAGEKAARRLAEDVWRARLIDPHDGKASWSRDGFPSDPEGWNVITVLNLAAPTT